MEKKDIYSIRKSTLGTVSAKISAITFLALAGGVALNSTDAHAEEVAQPTQPTAESKATPLKVTADDVNNAKNDRDKVAEDLKSNEDRLNNKTDEYNNVNNNIKNLTDDINKGKDADDIIKTNDDIINTNTPKQDELKNKLNDAIKTNDDAKNDLDNKNKELEDVKKDLGDAKNNLDQYNNITEPTPDEINDANNTVKKLTDDEKNAIDDVNTKEKRLNDEKQKDNDNQKRREQLVNDRKKAQDELDSNKTKRDDVNNQIKSLEDQIKKGFPYSLDILQSKEWTDLWKEWQRIGHEQPTELDAEYDRISDLYVKGDLPYDDWMTQANDIEARREKWRQDQSNRMEKVLVQLIDAEKRIPAGEYLDAPKEDEDTKYDVNHVSDLNNDLLVDLNQYFVNLLNKMQQTVGNTQGVKVNTNLIKFATDIAKEYENQHYTKSGHFGRGINNVARRYNLGTSAGPGVDTTGQYYENLMTMNTFGTYDSGISKARLYRLTRDWLHGFIYEASKTGHYRHAISLLNAQTLGLSFSYVDGILRMHVIQVTSPTTILEADKDGDKVFTPEEMKDAERIMEEKYGQTSKDTLPVKDFAAMNDEKARLNNLRTDFANLDKAIQDATDKVNDAQKGLDALDANPSNVTKATEDLNNARNNLKVIQDQKRTAENKLRDLEQRINDAKNLKEKRNLALNNYNKLVNDLKEREQERDQANDTYNTTRKTMDDLKRQLNDVTNTINNAIKNRDDARTLRSQVLNLQKRLADEKNRLSTLDKEISDLKDLIKKNQDELDKKDKEYINKKNLFDLDKLLNLKNNKNDKGNPFISGLPKVAPTEDDLPTVDIKETTKLVDIDFKVVEQEDPSLEAGQRVVKVKGQKGQKQIKTTTFTLGTDVLDTKVDETVLKEAVDEIVLVGTMKVETVETTREEPVPFKVVTQDDPTIPKGQRVVKVRGVEGKKVYKVTTKYGNGKVLDKQEILVSEVAPKDEIVLVGTRELKPGQTSKHINVRTEKLPYKTITRDNPTLKAGERRIIQKGVEGSQKVVRDDIYEGEKLVETGKEYIVEIVDAVDEIIEVGTKKEPTPLNPPKEPKDKTPKGGHNEGTKDGNSETPKVGSNVVEPTIVKGDKALPKTDAANTSAAGAGLIALVGAAVLAKRKEEK